MQIFIDDQPVEPAPQLDGSIEESVRQLQRDVCGDGRIVVALRCNGEEVQPEKLAEELQKPVVSLNKLELFTGLPGHLVGDAMSHAAEMLSALDQQYPEAATLLTEGKTNEGMNLLAACIQVWQQVHDAVGKSIDMLELDAESITVQDVSIVDAMERPKDVLVQLRNALQSGDFVLVADLLQYELKDVTELWHAVVSTIRREATRRIGNAGDGEHAGHDGIGEPGNGNA